MPPNLPARLPAQALALYLEHGSLAKVEKLCGVSLSTLKRWSEDYGWPKRRQRLIESLQRESEDAVTQLVRGSRAEVITRHLQTAALADDVIRDQLHYMQYVGPDGTEPKDIAQTVRAAKQSADISARVIGLDAQNTPRAALIAGEHLFSAFGVSPLPVQPVSQVVEAEYETMAAPVNEHDDAQPHDFGAIPSDSADLHQPADPAPTDP